MPRTATKKTTESGSEQVNNIRGIIETYESLIDQLDYGMCEEDLVELNNTFYKKYGIKKGIIYPMEEFDVVMKNYSPREICNLIEYERFDTYDKYFTHSLKGIIISSNNERDLIDVKALAIGLMERNDHLDCGAIKNLSFWSKN